jgi:hypothetical protein
MNITALEFLYIVLSITVIVLVSICIYISYLIIKILKALITATERFEIKSREIQTSKDAIKLILLNIAQKLIGKPKGGE